MIKKCVIDLHLKILMLRMLHKFVQCCCKKCFKKKRLSKKWSTQKLVKQKGGLKKDVEKVVNKCFQGGQTKVVTQTWFRKRWFKTVVQKKVVQKKVVTKCLREVAIKDVVGKEGKKQIHTV